jgi:hypothetical protein
VLNQDGAWFKWKILQAIYIMITNHEAIKIRIKSLFLINL